MVDGIADQGADIVLILRRDNPERANLEDTGIRGVEVPANIVEQHLPSQDAAQVIADVQLIGEWFLAVKHHQDPGERGALAPCFYANRALPPPARRVLSSSFFQTDP